MGDSHSSVWIYVDTRKQAGDKDQGLPVQISP